MKSPDQIRSITDREQRLRAATAALETIDEKRRTQIALRDMAICVANLDQDVSPVALYRDILGVSRGLFNRIKQRAPDDQTRATIVAEQPAKFRDSRRTASKAAQEIRRLTLVQDDVRKIRDKTAVAMMNGVADDGTRVTPVSNADIARITDLSTARIAQIRKGQR